jgi:hypothetical protein
MNKHNDIDVTISDPNGATPKQSFGWKPLNTNKMNWNHRRTKLNDAPSLLGRQRIQSPEGDKSTVSPGGDK